MNAMTEYFEVECPKCGQKFNIPYWKEIKPMTEEELLLEMSDAMQELERWRGK